MKSKSYIKSIFLFVIFLLTATALTNFIVDPEQVYPKLSPNTDNQQILSNFSKELALSKYGILNKYRYSDGTMRSHLNERVLKRALALFSEDGDCAILGSSHIMEISSFRENKSLTKYCKSVINLGVSGGTLEDYFAYSNMLLENKHTVNTIVFGIDPWSLKLNSDKRFNINKEDLYKMQKRLGMRRHNSNASYTSSLILNLINLEYLIKSIDKIFPENGFKEKEKEKVNENQRYKHAEKFNQNKGVTGSIILPDGSLIYSSEYINNSKLSNKTFDGINGVGYKIQLDGTRWYDDDAINDLTNLVKFLQSKFNILFVMTPYHPKVWEHKQPTVEAMKIIESKVHMLAKKLNVTVIGSYNPAKLGCLEDEFSDFMHPTVKCLKKLERKIVIN